MKNLMRTSALVLTGALLIAACGNKNQKSEVNYRIFDNAL
jgi:hypothetical protein